MASGTRFANQLEAWAKSHAMAVDRPKDSIRVRLGGVEIFYGREAQDWLFGIFRKVTEADEDDLRKALGCTNWDGSLDTRRYWRGRVSTATALAGLEAWLERHNRVRSR